MSVLVVVAGAFVAVLGYSEIKFRSLHDYVAFNIRGVSLGIDHSYFRIRNSNLVLGYGRIYVIEQAEDADVESLPIEAFTLGGGELLFPLGNLILGDFAPEVVALDNTLIAVARDKAGSLQLHVQKLDKKVALTDADIRARLQNPELGLILPLGAGEGGTPSLSIDQFTQLPVIRLHDTTIFLHDALAEQTYRFNGELFEFTQHDATLRLSVVTTFALPLPESLDSSAQAAISPKERQLKTKAEIIYDTNLESIVYTGNVAVANSIVLLESLKGLASGKPVGADSAMLQLIRSAKAFDMEFSGLLPFRSGSSLLQGRFLAAGEISPFCTLTINDSGIVHALLSERFLRAQPTSTADITDTEVAHIDQNHTPSLTAELQDIEDELPVTPQAHPANNIQFHVAATACEPNHLARHFAPTLLPPDLRTSLPISGQWTLDATVKPVDLALSPPASIAHRLALDHLAGTWQIEDGSFSDSTLWLRDIHRISAHHGQIAWQFGAPPTVETKTVFGTDQGRELVTLVVNAHADSNEDTTNGMVFDVSASEIPAEFLNQIWPRTVAMKPREWFAANVTGYALSDFTAGFALVTGDFTGDSAGAQPFGRPLQNPLQPTLPEFHAHLARLAESTENSAIAEQAEAEGGLWQQALAEPSAVSVAHSYEYSRPTLSPSPLLPFGGWAIKDLRGQAMLQNATVQHLRGTSPITELDAKLSFHAAALLANIVSARQDELVLPQNGGHHLIVRRISENELAVIDRPEFRGAEGKWKAALPFVLELEAGIDAPLPALLAELDGEPFNLLTPRGVPWRTMRGDTSSRLQLQFPLFSNLSTREIDVKAIGDIRNFKYANSPVLGITAAARTMPLMITSGGLYMFGNATLDGTPARIEWQENFTTKPKYRRLVRVETLADDATIASYIGQETAELFGLEGETQMQLLATYPQPDQPVPQGHTVRIRSDLAGIAWNFGGVGLAQKSQNLRSFVRATFEEATNVVTGQFIAPLHPNGSFQANFVNNAGASTALSSIELQSTISAKDFSTLLIDEGSPLEGSVDLNINYTQPAPFSTNQATTKLVADLTRTNAAELLTPFLVDPLDSSSAKSYTTDAAQNIQAITIEASLEANPQASPQDNQDMQVDIGLFVEKNPAITLRGQFNGKHFINFQGETEIVASALKLPFPAELSREVQMTGSVPVQLRFDEVENSIRIRARMPTDPIVLQVPLYPIANVDAGSDGKITTVATFQKGSPDILVDAWVTIPSQNISANGHAKLNRGILYRAHGTIDNWAGNQLEFQYHDQKPDFKGTAAPPSDAAQVRNPTQEARAANLIHAHRYARLPVKLNEEQRAFLGTQPSELNLSATLDDESIIAFNGVFPRYEITAKSADLRPLLESDGTGGILFHRVAAPLSNVFVKAERVRLIGELDIYNVQALLLRQSATSQTVALAASLEKTNGAPVNEDRLILGKAIITPYTDSMRVWSKDFGSIVDAAGFSDKYRSGGMDILLQRGIANPHWQGGGTVTNLYAREFSPFLRLQEAISIAGLWGALTATEWPIQRSEGEFACNAETCIVEELVVASNSVSVIGNGHWSEESTVFEGVLVPIRTWNSILKALPLVSELIVGNEDDAFLGINFVWRDENGEQNLEYNPLSALEPGIIRLVRETAAQAQ